jgi:hypothetical protein
MQRKTTKEKCERLRTLDSTSLRDRCARFVAQHAQAITAATPEIPDALNDRAADIWEPLLILADLAGGNWPSLARQAAVSLDSSSQENNPISSLLLDIFVEFTLAQTDRLFTRDLVHRLSTRFLDRPWMALRPGKQLTDLWLAQQLRPYDIVPRSIWIGTTSAKGYLMDDFIEVFRRYVPRSEVDALLAESKKPEPNPIPSSGAEGRGQGEPPDASLPLS